MWRTDAAWMDGALESDIALIRVAMNRDGSAVERVSSGQIQLTLIVPAVAGLGNRLATCRDARGAQVPEKAALKEVAERVSTDLEQTSQ
jgi:hypothetical protein